MEKILEILEQRIKELNEFGNHLYSKWGTESYVERCTVHDIRTDLIRVEEKLKIEESKELSSLMRTDLWKELIEFSTAIFDISTDYLGKPIDKIVDEYLQSRPNSKAVTDEEIEKKAIEEGRNQYDLNEGLKMNAFIKGYSKGAKAMRDGLITK